MPLEEIILTGFTSLVSIALWYKIGALEAKIEDVKENCVRCKKEA